MPVRFSYSVLVVAALLFSYLLGSIPVGVLLARLRGLDPRTTGSGNIGATNVMRSAGKTLGIATLLGDILKGAVPTLVASHYSLPYGAVAVIGLAAFLGHLFPIYLRFKGGKGVATAVGIFLALSPLAVAADLVIFAFILYRWKYVSLGSLACAALMPVLMRLFGAPREYMILAFLMALLIFWKHRENIVRLRAGTENKISLGKSSKGVRSEE